MIEEALRFCRAYELWIYMGLGLAGIYFLRRFVLAWQDLREAVFGLERESAQTRLNQAASVVVLLLTMCIAEFILVSFIAPALPGAIPLPTATLNLLATPTTTLPAGNSQPSGGPSATQPFLAGSTPVPGCIPGQIEIVSPKNGDEVSGVVAIIGTAQIPNFGFYKFEIKRPDETIWLTIQAGNQAVTAGQLGSWDTSRLTPGEYQFALIVEDNQGKASTPCIISLRVAQPPEPTPGP
jgi:hypothetical protein